MLQDSTANNIVQDSTFLRFKNTLRLPLIKSVKYISTQNHFDHIYLKDSSFQDSLLKFLRYYNRTYQNIGKYETYYVDVLCFHDSSASLICNGENLQYGLLLLYDEASKEANVLTVSYGFPFDSEYHEMSFQIKDSETIILEISGQTEGEEGMPEDLETRKIVIKISKDGSTKTSYPTEF
ncbi:hypothetical protein [Sporocytophaga myxococcoides]|nr:hypothetical protein [Sporocytophaga myxococcoides]